MNSERLEYLKQMALENPNDAFPLYGMALEYQNEEPDKSVKYLEEVQEKFPEYLPVYYLLATMLYDRSEPARALELASKGIDLATRLGDAKALAELRQLKMNIEYE